MTGAAVACTTVQAQLGECARWDDRRGELLHVDILAGLVFRDRVDGRGGLVPVRSYPVPGTVGAIAPIQGDDGWLLAAGRGFIYLAESGELRPLAEVAPTGTRMNDAACDPQGRLWAGTVTDDQRPGGASLYRLDRDGHTEMVLGGLTVSNGMGWSPDGGTMYLVNSGPRVVLAFAFGSDSGAISDQRVVLEVPAEVGTPDGLTVDAEGDLWVAVYGAGRVRHYSPEGELLEELLVPAAETTSCAFAGERLDRLYVTTATEHWTEAQRRAEPGAGLVYRIDTDVTGRPAAPFAPDPAWWATVVG